MNLIKNYETVIGLEVHVELKTDTKIFCSCPTTFGAEPNTHCCPVCMGMPGTLPVLNKKVVDYAVKAGLATNCTITQKSKQDRKNYFYPDLPKAYQISQYDLPLCEHGHIDINVGGEEKRIGITRIHIEEDAGKLVHDDKYGTMIDCNRCGVLLIEIVSEPDIRGPEEAIAYLEKLRAIIMYTGVSDCKMQEGSLRCDVNLSVRKKGETKFGTRTEMKNLNSFSFISKAIEYEYKRQVEAIEAGEKIYQETRRFDANTGKTYSMRRKENANDYRYFPDPDLPFIEISDGELDAYRAEIPTLPDERKAQYMEKYGLDAYCAEMLINDISIADYFEKVAEKTTNAKIAANLLTGEVFRLLDPDTKEILISVDSLAAIANMADDQTINSSTAKRLVKEVWHSGVDPVAFVKEQDLAQINDEDVIRQVVLEVLERNAKSVADYKNGKQAALGAIVGQVMGKTRSKANPVIANKIILEEINK